MVQSIAIMAVATFLVFFCSRVMEFESKYSDDLYCGCTGHNSYNYRLSVWNDGFCMQCAAVNTFLQCRCIHLR